MVVVVAAVRVDNNKQPKKKGAESLVFPGHSIIKPGCCCFVEEEEGKKGRRRTIDVVGVLGGQGSINSSRRQANPTDSSIIDGFFHSSLSQNWLPPPPAPTTWACWPPPMAGFGPIFEPMIDSKNWASEVELFMF